MNNFLQSSKSLTIDFDLIWNCLSPLLPPLSSSHTGLLFVYQTCSLNLALCVPGALPCCPSFIIQTSSNVASSVKPFPNHAFQNSIFQCPSQSGFLYSHLFYFLLCTSLCLEFISFIMYLLYTQYMLGIVLGTWDSLMNKKDKKRIPVLRKFTLVGSREKQYIKTHK